MEIDDLDERIAAAVFKRLVLHLRHRSDAQNVDLMGLAGFCRNCLGDWTAEASNGQISKLEGREIVYGMPYDEWKSKFHREATPGQLQRMKESLALNSSGAGD